MLPNTFSISATYLSCPQARCTTIFFPHYSATAIHIRIRALFRPSPQLMMLARARISRRMSIAKATWKYGRRAIGTRKCGCVCVHISAFPFPPAAEAIARGDIYDGASCAAEIINYRWGEKVVVRGGCWNLYTYVRQLYIRERSQVIIPANKVSPFLRLSPFASANICIYTFSIRGPGGIMSFIQRLDPMPRTKRFTNTYTLDRKYRWKCVQ